MSQDQSRSKQRTLTQNRALHLYFAHLASALSDAGLDIQETLKHDFEIPWSPVTIKELLFRPVMKAQLNKSSTTELNTKDIDKVFETINRHLSTKFGLSVDFPSIESLMMKKRIDETLRRS